MSWIDLRIDRERKEAPVRQPKLPKLTIYKDGVGKLTAAAQAHLENGIVHVLHNTENPKLIGISAAGQFPHKVGKQGTFSAASLWRLAGRPSEPIHVDLVWDDEAELLVGDLDAALERAQAERDARMTLSEGESALAPSAESEVDPSVSDTDLSGPSASGPSDTSDPYEDDEDEYDEDEDDEAEAASTPPPIAAQY